MSGLIKIDTFSRIPEKCYPLDEEVSVSYYVGHFVGSSFRIDGRRDDYSEAVKFMEGCDRLRPDKSYFLYKIQIHVQKF